jgi:formate/nitrite transporter
MDYVKPEDVAISMLSAGASKLRLSPGDLLIRGALSGAILGVATTLALTGAVTTGQPIVGAVIFPVGLVSIVLMGLELVTGSFALVPLPWVEGRADLGQVVKNWAWVMLGNLVGAVAYALLASIVLTNLWTSAPAGVAAKIASAAEAKTIGYAALGAAGFITCFVKAVLCNWMVCLAVVLAMTTTSAIGKIVAAWLPIFIFFAQGFEHLVVNFFLIPAGMMMGAKVSIVDWIVWNAIPVTAGNIVGGFLFTGLAIYWTFRPAKNLPVTQPMIAPAPAE